MRGIIQRDWIAAVQARDTSIVVKASRHSSKTQSNKMENPSLKSEILEKFILQPTLSLVVLAFTGIIACWVASIFKVHKPDFPLVGQNIGNAEQRRKAYNQDARPLYNEGYTKHRARPFRITTFDGKSSQRTLQVLNRRLTDVLRTRRTYCSTNFGS